MVTQNNEIPDRDNMCGVRCVHKDRVNKAQKNAPDTATIDRLAALFRILGDPGRLRIVTALKYGEMCVCDLAAYLEVSESATSHQLRKLRDQGLVSNRRDGQVLYYALARDDVDCLVKDGMNIVRFHP